jgi:predicted alpha/beta superfamily hydrolase
MMIQKSVPLIFLLFSINGFSQTIIKKTITSDYSDTTREIKIYLPKGYDKNEEKNYPIAIVLDAEYMFDF